RLIDVQSLTAGVYPFREPDHRFRIQFAHARQSPESLGGEDVASELRGRIVGEEYAPKLRLGEAALLDRADGGREEARVESAPARLFPARQKSEPCRQFLPISGTSDDANGRLRKDVELPAQLSGFLGLDGTIGRQPHEAVQARGAFRRFLRGSCGD